MPFTIRLFAYSAVSCLVLAGTARADVDFSALLAQLPSLESESDGDGLLDPGIDAEPLAAEAQIPDNDVPADSPSDQLAPSSDDLEPTAEALAAPAATAAPSPARTLGGPPVEVNPITPQSATATPSEITPYTILEAEPVPGTAEASIDFQQMFEAQQTQPTDVAMGQQYSHAAAPCGCTGPQHYCQPHRRPSLPPPATLESMYHCPPCYRDLWAGYEAERQRACDNGHQHIHNRCDCFKPECQPACQPAACDDTTCDDTACDQSPGFFSRLFH